MSIADQIVDGVSGITSVLAGGLGFIAILVLIIAIGFVVLVIAIILRRKFDFEGSGERLGRFRLIMMGKPILEVNLAKWEMINDDGLRALANDPDLVFVPDIIKQMYNEETLHIYTAKITDEFDSLERYGNRTFIISSGKLESDEFSWVDQKSKLTLRTLFTKEQTRNVVIFYSVKKVEVLNEDRNMDDWYIVTPIPFSKSKQMIGFNSKAVEGFSHHIELREITNADVLAKALDFAPYVADAESKNKHLRDELKKTTELLDITRSKLGSVNQKLNKKKLQLGQKEYVINKREEVEKEEKLNLAFLIMSVFMGGLAVMFVPNFFKNLDMQTAQVVGMIIAVLIVGGFAYIQRKKPTKKEEYED